MPVIAVVNKPLHLLSQVRGSSLGSI